MWRSYKQLWEQGLDNYMDALKLGYTKSIGDIYETAGIKFDFSASYVKELSDFIKEELKKLSWISVKNDLSSNTLRHT